MHLVQRYLMDGWVPLQDLILIFDHDNSQVTGHCHAICFQTLDKVYLFLVCFWNGSISRSGRGTSALQVLPACLCKDIVKPIKSRCFVCVITRTWDGYQSQQSAIAPRIN